MNPYGKTPNWLCRRKDHCDTSPRNGRTTPSLLRLDSTGNTLCEKDLQVSIPRSMASCLVKTIGGFTGKSSQPQDNLVSCGTDFPTLQNMLKNTCDSDMAAKNYNSMTRPVKPQTSCIGGLQGLAGCLGMNAYSPISQHQTLQPHNFHFEFHPAVVSSFPQNSDSAKKQYSKCQSQRTGKKSNRYFRYGWTTPQRKHSPDGEKVASWKPENDVHKKQKCEPLVTDPKVEKQKHFSESGRKKKIEMEKKCTDIGSKDSISSPLSNLSLGESVAIKNALNLNQCSMSCSDSTDVEKPKPDWFNLGRSDSDNRLSPSNTAIVLDNWDDEISAEIRSENVKLQEDILDLLATEDGKKKSENSAKLPDIPGNTDILLQSPDNDFGTLCTSRVKSNGSEGLLNKIDTNAVESSVCENSEPHAVLYLRTMSKKGRPSHKKRSRRKGSKHSKSFSSDQGQKRKFEDGNSSKSGACAIAFIIGGLDTDFSLDSDTCSDLSFDSDEDSSESLEDDIDFVRPFSDPLLTNILCPAKTSPIQHVSQAVSDANRAWQISLQEPKTTITGRFQGDKKVHFPEPEDLTETHVADDWNRKGPWEEYARDRERFKRRIEDLKCIIDPVLDENHRQNMYLKLQKEIK